MKAIWTRDPQSWGATHRQRQKIYRPRWRSELLSLVDHLSPDQSFLAKGLGRSYGDSCLLASGSLIDCTQVDRIRAFDREKGIIVADAGCSLGALLEVIVPSGWFLPVTPGTKYVSLGGAVANDVHGKNHHTSGTFGRHILQITLKRSDGELITLSPNNQAELFRATVGGLGLTGVMETITLQLKPITSPLMEVETVPLRSLDDFFTQTDASDRDFEYTVSWIDCMANGAQLGKGLLMRGRHATPSVKDLGQLRQKSPLPFPITAPRWLLNRHTVANFNKAYYALNARKEGLRLEPYEPFFYPLDMISGWNKMYGKRGFFQLQFVTPQPDVIKNALEKVASWGTSSFLVVLKKFGAIASPGLLSFPQPGYTLTLDFPNQGDVTVKQILTLADMAIQDGGRLYPAKDDVMTADMFRAGFPKAEDILTHKDPRITSDFWRRVMEDRKA